MAAIKWTNLRGQTTICLGRTKRREAKRAEEQNLARMAPWKPLLETLRRLFLRGASEGNSRNF